MNELVLPELDLAPQQLAIVRTILQRVIPDRAVWAFGSRVQGRAKPYSDLDLVVMGEQALSLSDSAELIEAFDESDLTIKVDVVDWASASEAFREIIAKRKVLVQGRE
ncbi:MAG: nucleotidyltransferase domain-containing protein [Gallionella sp.]|nr:nucleotidyltransferase domain-containing protein [Gallionella sp.]MDD4946697.1 nucleotidyltransferase domain-containing protein [Gallionella sp.]MDD5612528.1 nucleotidyltransferase domain-containing protein [Gallionella sp.]